MVVASRTVNCEPQKCLANCGEDFLEFILSSQQFHSFAAADNRIMNTGHPESGGCGSFHASRKLIANQLHADEFVVRHITVECVDDPVAIRPRVHARLVAFKTTAFTEPHHVQPVSGPAFTVVLRFQQVIDKVLIRLLGGAGAKRVHDFRRRWQPNQVKKQPANQDTRRSLGRRM